MKTPSGLRRVRIAFLLGLVAVLAAPAVHAVRQREKENLPVAPDEEWRESAAVAPPPYPQDGNLIEFDPGGTTTNRFYVDGSSLTVGEDEVVRFVLVIETMGKTRNVRYAGLRCETREWKTYAFSDAGRGWRVDQGAQWQRVEDKNRNNYQYALAKDYFCFGGVTSGGPLGDAKALVRNLKYPLVQDNRTPRRYNSPRGAATN